MNTDIMKNKKKFNFKKNSTLMNFIIEYGGMILVLVGMIIFFGIKSKYFFSTMTFTTIANQIPSLAVMSVGMTYILIIGGIDLSVGSVMALSGVVLSILLEKAGWGLLEASIAAILVGAICGFFNGFISEHWKIPAFIVTLGMLEMARGGSFLFSNSRTTYLGSVVEGLSEPFLGEISPAFLIAVVIIILGQIILKYTVFGRYIIGIGTNEEAMRLSGVKIKPIKIAVFTISGIMCAVGSLFFVSRFQSANPNGGSGMELSVIAAVVIGGTSLNGGRGSVISSFIGVLIISILEAGLAQIGASEPTKRLISGAVIIFAVIVDVYKIRFKKRA